MNPRRRRINRQNRKHGHERELLRRQALEALKRKKQEAQQAAEAAFVDELRKFAGRRNTLTRGNLIDAALKIAARFKLGPDVTLDVVVLREAAVDTIALELGV